MGKALARQNSRQRKLTIEWWQKSSWDVSFKPVEIRSSLITEKNRLTSELDTLKEQSKVLQDTVSEFESTKVNKLECVVQENQRLQESVCEQREQNEKLKEGHDCDKDTRVSKQQKTKELGRVLRKA